MEPSSLEEQAGQDLAQTLALSGATGKGGPTEPHLGFLVDGFKSP